MLRTVVLGIGINIMLCGVAASANINTADRFHITDDFLVDDTGVIDADQIFVDGSATIVNRGEIAGDIFVADGCQVYIQNSGNMTGEIHLGTNAFVTQVITSADDMTDLDIWGDYSVLVRGNGELNLADIKQKAPFANEIILENATIKISNADGVVRLFRRHPPEIKLMGEVTINIDPNTIHDGDIILSGISGDGAVLVHAPGLNDLFIATTQAKNGNLYLKIIRETDYFKILDFERGSFMNILRNLAPEDKFVLAMDTAQSRDEMERVMANSVRFNPLNLMRHVRVIDAFELADFQINNGLSAKLDGVYMDGCVIPTFNAAMGLAFGPVEIGVNGRAAVANISDDLNDFAGLTLGGDIRAGLDLKYVWMRSIVGISFSDFDVGPVLGADEMRIDPKGRSVYGATDIGIRIKSGNFSFMPFVGIEMTKYAIAGFDERNLSIRGGIAVGSTIETDGLRYDVKLRAMGADGKVVGGMVMGIYSVWDGLGIDVAADIYHDDITPAYRLSVTGKCAF